MMRRGRWLAAGACAALTAIGSGAARAQSLDQSNGGGAIEFFDPVVQLLVGTRWCQSFTPGVSGQLHAIEAFLKPPAEEHWALGNQIFVEFHAANADGTPSNILAVTEIRIDDYPIDLEDEGGWVSPHLSSANLALAKNRKYALCLAASYSGGAASSFWVWQRADGYARGELFAAPAGGLPFSPVAGQDVGFRTFMIEEPYCGDGDATPGEACDDGNTASGDGCSSACVVELCGDGVTNDVNETCDDGNTVSGDGCDADCYTEFCGDGITNDTDETCDDGNTSSNDGCSSACRTESCGDGSQQTSEECDDGNTASGDGCSAACATEFCGDGTTNDVDEQCDDGNTVSNDGCSATCVLESCGDGTKQTSEQCDDGNTVSNDGCSATCTDELCGDDTEQTSEGCDDGNTVPNDGCSATCEVESCGDGIVQSNEACDDGNTAAADGCSATCELESDGLACRTAIAKAAQKYATARLGALQQCRLRLLAGQPVSVAAAAACPTETVAAKRIAKGAAQARKIVAGGARPKCTDLLVTMLHTCGATVDALIAPNAATGCLRDAGDDAIESLLVDVFGDPSQAQ